MRLTLVCHVDRKLMAASKPYLLDLCYHRARSGPQCHRGKGHTRTTKFTFLQEDSDGSPNEPYLLANLCPPAAKFE